MSPLKDRWWQFDGNSIRARGGRLVPLGRLDGERAGRPTLWRFFNYRCCEFSSIGHASFHDVPRKLYHTVISNKRILSRIKRIKMTMAEARLMWRGSVQAPFINEYLWVVQFRQFAITAGECGNTTVSACMLTMSSS